MFLYQKDVIEIKETEFGWKLLKHSNKDWYVSFRNPLRWHCLYTEDEYTARVSVLNNQYGPELFLTSK